MPRCTRRVPSVDPFYFDAHAVIVPVIYGSAYRD